MSHQHERGRLIGHVLFCAALLAIGAAAAQTPSGAGMPPPPPPEALAACKGLASGSDCSVKGPNGTIKGSCWAPPEKALACRPKDAPKGPPQGAASPK